VHEQLLTSRIPVSVIERDCRSVILIGSKWVESPATAPCGFPLCVPDSVESYTIVYSHDRVSFPRSCLPESSLKLKAYSFRN
jgi:hypothetical protein